jgi:hypothetical protein
MYLSGICIWDQICLCQGQGPVLCEEVLHKAPPFKQLLRSCLSSPILSGGKKICHFSIISLLFLY